MALFFTSQWPKYLKGQLAFSNVCVPALSLSLSLSLSHARAHTHTHTLSLTHSLTHSHTHTHTHSLSLSLTPTPTRTRASLQPTIPTHRSQLRATAAPTPQTSLGAGDRTSLGAGDLSPRLLHRIVRFSSPPDNHSFKHCGISA